MPLPLSSTFYLATADAGHANSAKPMRAMSQTGTLRTGTLARISILPFPATSQYTAHRLRWGRFFFILSIPSDSGGSHGNYGDFRGDPEALMEKVRRASGLFRFGERPLGFGRITRMQAGIPAP
jgi:hypothetical protein